MKKKLFFIAFLSISFASNAQENWGYTEVDKKSPQDWKDLQGAEKCGRGKHQSPINIVRIEAKRDKKLPKIEFNYRDGKIQSIDKNGHTIQFNFRPGTGVKYDGKDYELVQFHAHSESEHTINGVRYPLELHFVHRDKNGDLLVIAVMVKEGEKNTEFEKLTAFRYLKDHEKEEVKLKFDPTKIYPKSKTYYHYIGSLTTPPCSESVNWIVFRNPITISVSEVREIANNMPKNNNRPVQDLNDRTVSYK